MPMSLDRRIIASMRSVLGEGRHPLHEPIFGGNEQSYVQECIKSTYVSSVGRYVDQFESELAAFTGARRAIAVVNGTAALQVALQLAGVKPGDEVLIPALTFIATANSIIYLGAKPHFVDSSLDTLGVNPLALKDWLKHIVEWTPNGVRNRFTGRRISALVPMHTFGHPCNMDELVVLARDYQLQLVEDAAESLGSCYQGRHTGTFGLLGTLSFNGNKTITTGGGGAILTNDEQLADHAKHLTTTAKKIHRWDYVHDEVGYNFRMPNINAALGCAQLEQLPAFLDSKRRLTKRYLDAFVEISELELMIEPADCKSNYWLQTLILDEAVSDRRNHILEVTNACGLMTRPAWTLMHYLSIYQDCPRAPLPIAESLAARIINIPSSAGLA